MDTSQIRIWTKTLYAIIQALSLAKNADFGRLENLAKYTKDASDWIEPDCSYQSVLLAHPMGDRRVTFRRDPAEHFDEITKQVMKMLIQDLVTILDELMKDILIRAEAEVPNYPLSKVLALKHYLDPEYEWAYQGCVELIACRNVMSHSQGKWTERSIGYVRDFVVTPPEEGDILSIGFSMLFRFRKAIRTFINDVESELWPPETKVKKKKKRKPSSHQIRRIEKKLQRARGRAALDAKQST